MPEDRNTPIAAEIGPILLNSEEIRTRVQELGLQITRDYRGKR